MLPKGAPRTKPKRITVVSLEKTHENINKPEGIVVSQELLDEPVQTPNEEQLNKPKPKRKPRAIPSSRTPTTPCYTVKDACGEKQDEPTQQPEINVVNTLDEIVAEVVLPDMNTMQSKDKLIEKVKCPDCGKMVSEKTFKYTHTYNCKSKKEATKEQEVEVKEQDESKEEQSNDNYEYKPVEITLPPPKPIRLESQKEIRNRLRTERLKALFANAV